MKPTLINSIATALLLGALAGAPARVSAAGQQIPDKLGKLTLRMSLDDAKKAYPEMTVQEASAAANKGVEPPFAFATGKMKDLPYETLHCDASLIFFQKQLISVEYHCPKDGEVRKYLEKTLGPPTTAGVDGDAEWKQAARTVIVDAAGKAMTVLDNEANSAFQLMLFTYASSQTAGTPSPMPQATPAP